MEETAMIATAIGLYCYNYVSPQQSECQLSQIKSLASIYFAVIRTLACAAISSPPEMVY